MKVCFWGNQGNSSYRLCKWLREKGLDAHLYMMKNANKRSYPELVDTDLSEGYPDWIHVYDNQNILDSVFIHKKLIRDIESKFDIVVLSGLHAALGGHSFNMPMVMISSGPTNIGVVHMDQYYKRYDMLAKFRWVIVRFFCRKTVKKCQRVSVHFDPEIYSLQKLGAISKQFVFAFPEDVSGNRERVDQALLKQLNEQYGEYDKVFLWLSRVNYRVHGTPDYKGVDNFMASVKRLLDQDGENIKIIVGEHGYDWQELQSWVRENGLEKYFDYVPHLPYWKLLTYLSIQNSVVFDEIIDNFFSTSSGMLREALSVGAVVCKSFSETLTSLAYGPGCPVLKANDEQKLYEQMKLILSWDEARFREQQNASEQWALKYLHWENSINKLVAVLEEVHYSHQVYRRLKDTRL